MTKNITRGTKEEYQEIIAFGDMVFKEDFKSLLPKLYDNHAELADCHFLVKEEDRLCAMVGSFPLSFWVCGQKLNARGIGTVSVHPEHRGKGYMQEAMHAALQAAEEENADFLCLGGNRQRYEYFGFGKGAGYYCVTLTRANKKHAGKQNGMTVRVLGDETRAPEDMALAKDKELLAECHALHSAQPVSSRRPLGDFAEVTATWKCKIYVVLEDGEFLGYASIGGENPGAHEFYLKDDSRGADAAFALLGAVGKEALEFKLQMHQTALMESLTRVSEHGTLHEGELVNVLNYPGVLTAFLTLKAQTQELLDGEMVLDIPERGRYLVTVQNNDVKVTKTERAYDISLPHLEMMYYLFSPLAGCRHRSALEKSWFPAPLVLPEQDMT